MPNPEPSSSRTYHLFLTVLCEDDVGWLGQCFQTVVPRNQQLSASPRNLLEIQPTESDPLNQKLWEVWATNLCSTKLSGWFRHVLKLEKPWACIPCFSRTAWELRLRSCIPAPSRPRTSPSLTKPDLSTPCNEGEPTLKEPNKRKDSYSRTWKRCAIQRKQCFLPQSKAGPCWEGSTSSLDWKRTQSPVSLETTRLRPMWGVQKSLIWSPALGLQRGMFSMSKWLTLQGKGGMFHSYFPVSPNAPPPKFLLVKFQAAKFQGVYDLSIFSTSHRKPWAVTTFYSRRASCGRRILFPASQQLAFSTSAISDGQMARDLSFLGPS